MYETLYITCGNKLQFTSQKRAHKTQGASTNDLLNHHMLYTTSTEDIQV